MLRVSISVEMGEEVVGGRKGLDMCLDSVAVGAVERC